MDFFFNEGIASYIWIDKCLLEIMFQKAAHNYIMFF